MIVAVVGHAYSMKDKVARAISAAMNVEYRRIRKYTGYPVINRARQSYGPGYPEDEIFYTNFNSSGKEFSTLKRDLVSHHTVFYIEDSVEAVKGIEALGESYVIVFTDCSEETCLERAAIEHDNLEEVKDRMQSNPMTGLRYHYRFDANDVSDYVRIRQFGLSVAEDIADWGARAPELQEV